MFNVSLGRSATTLHLALGLILAVEAALTMMHAVSEHHDVHLFAFGAFEGLGALLFIWPRTIRVGACILVCAFAVAAVVHLLRGEFPSEHLVYAVAVLFVMIHRGNWQSPSKQPAA